MKKKGLMVLLVLLTLAGITIALVAGSLTAPPIKPEPVKFVQSNEREGRIITKAEAEKALEIIRSDERVKKMIGNVSWKPLDLLYNQVVYNDRIAVVMILDRPVWVETEIYSKKFGENVTAKLWTKSIDVVVDLKKGEVVYLYPNMRRGERTPPIKDKEEIEKARKVALEYQLAKQLKPIKKSCLNAIYYIPNHYPSRVAYFRVFDDENETLVAVDLNYLMRVLKLYASRL